MIPTQPFFDVLAGIACGSVGIVYFVNFATCVLVAMISPALPLWSIVLEGLDEGLDVGVDVGLDVDLDGATVLCNANR